MKNFHLLPLLAVAATTCTAGCGRGQSDVNAPLTLVDAFPAQEKFDRPVYLDHHRSDPDHYYVVTQAGHVFRIPRDGGDGGREVFLDWTGKCLAQPAFQDGSNGANWEEGLLGFAFDPDYSAERPWVYIYYSEATGQEGTNRRGAPRLKRQSVVSRLAVEKGDGGEVTADPASELRILEVAQPFGNHNGGTILFGPDQMLYVVLGDGGAANDPYGNGQNLTTLLGSLLRIDVRNSSAETPYEIPTDNPFVDHEDDEVRPEIWAYGLRNLWRISFDRSTGKLWGADVGQNKFEEVNVLEKGGNYGWNFREGFEAFDLRRQEGEAPDDLLPPVVVYPRSDGVSITGGYVYRGEALPDLVGAYIYGDFQTQRIWALDPSGDEPEVTAIGRAPALLASFAEEPSGELLALCFDGRIYRLAPADRGQ